nr:endonuclease/exonuclease/phosphatase family protein [Eikenella exigua]
MAKPAPSLSAWLPTPRTQPLRPRPVEQPLAACEVRMIGDYPYIRAQTADGTALYALHPPPPISSELAGARQHYLAETACALAAEPRALAVGDFNSSPFSPLFRRFLQESGSRPATRYFTPTWKPFFLNIDHALAKGLNVSARTLPWQYSDHRPLLVEYTGQ